jgi:hypothetical protein
LSAGRFITDAAFWENSVKFGLLDGATVEETRVRSRRYPDDLVLGILGDDRLEPAFRSPLFGAKTIGDVEARLKANLYSMHFPSYYFAALEDARIYQRGSGNWNIYHEVLGSRGHRLLWTGAGSRALSPETTIKSFAPSPLLDSYFSETLDLFQKRNIPVYYIGFPLNDVSTAALQPGFAGEFDSYIRNYEKIYSNFHCLGKTLTTLPWTDFGEAAHLNAKGAEVFSTDVAAQLRAAGIEN